MASADRLNFHRREHVLSVQRGLAHRKKSLAAGYPRGFVPLQVAITPVPEIVVPRPFGREDVAA